VAAGSTDPPEAPPPIDELLWPTTIEHPGQFVTEMSGVTSSWVTAYETQRVWFRGVPKLSFTLEPSLLRYREAGRDLEQTESNVRGHFLSQGAPWLSDAATKDTLQLLTVMQHHGVPTRLLDWSENAFAALYFAVREHAYLGDTEDAVVWLLEPVRLATLVAGYRGIPYSTPDLLATATAKGPLPFYPAHRSPRVGAQRATFTIHPFAPQHALVKLALQEKAAGRPPPLAGLRVLGTQRAHVRDGLVTAFGLGDFTLFPDLDGLARELRIREKLEGKG
jgi:hypothetical protein